MLPYVIGGAVVLGVLAWLSASENKARQELENSQHRLKMGLNRMSGDIQNARKSSNDSVRFEKYIALYKASVEQSNSQYQDYSLHKKLISTVTKKRNEIGRKIGQLKQKRYEVYGKARQAVIDELNACYAWLKEIKAEIARLQNKKSELLDTVRQINQNTHNIKIAIRDNCGRGGRIWYDNKMA